jgi:hypothetical protein
LLYQQHQSVVVSATSVCISENIPRCPARKFLSIKYDVVTGPQLLRIPLRGGGGGVLVFTCASETTNVRCVTYQKSDDFRFQYFAFSRFSSRHLYK